MAVFLAAIFISEWISVSYVLFDAWKAEDWFAENGWSFGIVADIRSLINGFKNK